MFDRIIKLTLLISPLAYMHGRTIDAFDCLMFHVAFCVLVASLVYSSVQIKKCSALLYVLAVCVINTAFLGLKEISTIATTNLAVAVFIVCVMRNMKDSNLTNIFI